MALALAQPPSHRSTGRREADTVLACVGGAEGKFPRVGAFGVDDAVVVVEDFVDGDGDGEVRVCGEGIVLGLEGAVVAYGVDGLDIVLYRMLLGGGAHRRLRCP